MLLPKRVQAQKLFNKIIIYIRKKKTPSRSVNSYAKKGSALKSVQVQKDQTQEIPSKRIQVLGLANTHTWATIKDKMFGIKQTPIGFGPAAYSKGKGKKKHGLEVVVCLS